MQPQQLPQVASNFHHALAFAAAGIGADDSAVDHLWLIAPLLINLQDPIPHAGQTRV